MTGKSAVWLSLNCRNMSEKVRLRRIEYPEYPSPAKVAPPTAEELSGRILKVREAMRGAGLTHLVVYGDREHFANLAYLTNYDPRFEEAFLVLGDSGTPLLLVGNEGVGHLGVSALYNSEALRYERFQTFSLMNQPKEDSRSLESIFIDEGIGQEAMVGVVGWKYYPELPDSTGVSDAPAYIWNSLCRLSKNVVNSTDLMISPSYGLRSRLSVYEIALFEFSNIMASGAVRAILENLRPGLTDFELMSKVPFTGYPFSCHPSVKSSGNSHYGLSSPTGDVIEEGKSCSMSVAYWGSNVCRAGWVVKDESGLPPEAKDYVGSFAAPFFLAVRHWLKELRIGTQGRVLYDIIANDLPFAKFGVYLNPGHLIHYDEWLSSPIYKDSTETIESGMCVQIDIIPRSKEYSSVRMEEGVVVADLPLRERLRNEYPDVYDRCMRRRAFMEELGFELPEELLPLSDLAGVIPPFLLDKNLVLSL